MRTFEVLAPIQLSNKRIAKFGDKVSEKQLHDNADELLKRKFIKEVEVEEKKGSEKPISEMNKTELLAFAESNSITVDKTASKANILKVIEDFINNIKVN